MNTMEKEREDRFVKMTVERIKKMIAEDIRTRKFFDGKTDLEAEARKLIHQARELARKEHEANRVDFPHLQYTRTESINKTDFPDDFVIAEFYRQTGMNASSIEVFEEITQEEYQEENSFGFRFNYKFREPVTYYKFTVPIPEEVQK
jgi:hypothetical protein